MKKKNALVGGEAQRSERERGKSNREEKSKRRKMARSEKTRRSGETSVWVGRVEAWRKRDVRRRVEQGNEQLLETGAWNMRRSGEAKDSAKGRGSREAQAWKGRKGWNDNESGNGASLGQRKTVRNGEALGAGKQALENGGARRQE